MDPMSMVSLPNGGTDTLELDGIAVGGGALRRSKGHTFQLKAWGSERTEVRMILERPINREADAVGGRFQNKESFAMKCGVCGTDFFNHGFAFQGRRNNYCNREMPSNISMR